MPNEPKLIPFTSVRVSIPRQLIIRLWNKKDFITYKEAVKTRQKLKQINEAIIRLRSIASLAEQVLLKYPSSKS